MHRSTLGHRRQTSDIPHLTSLHFVPDHAFSTDLGLRQAYSLSLVPVDPVLASPFMTTVSVPLDPKVGSGDSSADPCRVEALLHNIPHPGIPPNCGSVPTRDSSLPSSPRLRRLFKVPLMNRPVSSVYVENIVSKSQLRFFRLFSLMI
ncbi:unnamed protein product [Protopolystoma xenopodis]|uniref:Uncharacterized protein n=1 Tax=Protopolystoma xenopodis TaxID=117903 RepID=A0A3S5AFD1_9PLAT|nr:unnamed protein product [Protopolystoma xenopodis]